MTGRVGMELWTETELDAWWAVVAFAPNLGGQLQQEHRLAVVGTPLTGHRR